jgi:hypothetical protein
MKPHLAFLLGSAAVLLTAGATQAAPSAPSLVPGAQSYVDLLDPVPNAEAVLVADDLARAQQPKPLLKLVQYHHHHHHHHHHGFFPGFGITVAPPVYDEGPDCYIRRRVVINRWGERVVRRVRVCD